MLVQPLSSNKCYPKWIYLTTVSAENLDEKREVEFQRMLSQLSREEVAESQQEYQQLFEDGGLNSLTPTDDWESRDPDTPETELEDDSLRKPGTSSFSQRFVIVTITQPLTLYNFITRFSSSSVVY